MQQFDVDIEYMGRLRGEALAAFRRKGTNARLSTLRRALQGGSITPEAWAGLKPLVEDGTLRVYEETAVAGAEWDEVEQCLAVWSEVGRGWIGLVRFAAVCSPLLAQPC
jgi:hypothetical protein